MRISNDHMSGELLPKTILESAVSKGYKLFHIGLVQMAVKPLTHDV